MTRRACAMAALAMLLAMVAACGKSAISGIDSATATALFQANQTIVASPQIPRNLPSASAQAIRTEYAQSATNGTTAHMTGSAGSRGTSAGGITSTASTATPRSNVTPAVDATGVRSTSAPTLPAAAAFRDPAGRFSFLIPAGWSVAPPSATGIIAEVVSVTPRGSVNVATEIVTAAQTLDEYTTATMATIGRAYEGYQFSTAGAQPTILGTYPARRYDFSSGGDGGMRMRFTQFVTLVGTTAYVLTLSCAESDSAPFLSQAALILDTFRFGDDRISLLRAS